MIANVVFLDQSDGYMSTHFIISIKLYICALCTFCILILFYQEDFKKAKGNKINTCFPRKKVSEVNLKENMNISKHGRHMLGS